MPGLKQLARQLGSTAAVHNFNQLQPAQSKTVQPPDSNVQGPDTMSDYRTVCTLALQRCNANVHGSATPGTLF